MNLTLDHDNKNLKTQSACNQSNNPIEHHCYMSKDITENIPSSDPVSQSTNTRAKPWISVWSPRKKKRQRTVFLSN
ncbi:hypothetical protein L5515_017234 [Caenorhabditis briggsae]|uniref:Uncharacterized protein n=1 Tax=Caenorhabditis briggsae TaxID=6238 RepID=A0AAE9F8X5_CAEBR|nr:hypothetical protein L5515_017234 [Caenorhabditis briggsae]